MTLTDTPKAGPVSEVTEAMMKAGNETYAKWSYGRNGHTPLVEAIYQAMHSASQQSTSREDVVERLKRAMFDVMRQWSIESGSDDTGSFEELEAEERLFLDRLSDAAITTLTPNSASDTRLLSNLTPREDRG